MRKLVLLIGAVVSLGALSVLPTGADDETVNATVTAKVVSISVNTNNLAYGSLGLGTNNNAPTPSNILVTNSGTVTEDFKIRGSASSPAGWTLTSDDPEANTYRHRFDISPTGGFSAALGTSSQGLFNDVTASGDLQVYFQLDMPTSTSASGFGEQTLPIVVTALESMASGPN